jgi:hypothetical protein
MTPANNLNSSLTVVKDDTTTSKSTTQSTANPSSIKDSTVSVIGSTAGSTQQERVLITGDDILIEYVERLMNEIKNVDDNGLKPAWKS